MSKRNKEIGKKVKELIDRKGGTSSKLANDFNVAKSTVSAWINGERKFDMDLIDELAEYFNVSPTELAGYSNDVSMESIDRDIVKIPIVGEVKAGYDLLAEQNIVGYNYLPRSMVNGHGHFCLRVTGDSMTGSDIKQGDELIVRKQPGVDNGQIAVILLENDEVTVKKVFYDEKNQVILQSSNTDTPPRVYQFDDIKILGVVKKIIKNV